VAYGLSITFVIANNGDGPVLLEVIVDGGKTMQDSGVGPPAEVGVQFYKSIHHTGWAK
jgi:hypothetical protein